MSCVVLVFEMLVRKIMNENFFLYPTEYIYFVTYCMPNEKIVWI